MFAFILTYCDVSNPLLLWNTFKRFMMEDFVYRGMSEYDAEQATLSCIDNVLDQGGKNLSCFDLPQVINPMQPNVSPSTDLSVNDLVFLRQQLNVEQQQFSNAVLSAANLLRDNAHTESLLFYLDAPGGTGKTFTFNYLMSELKSIGFKVASAAPTGIAAQLLNGGSTLHRLFRLPVPIVENSTCKISPTTQKAQVLRDTDVFFIDEASSINKHALHAIDRVMRDITNSNMPFGGKIVVMGGDFRQTLPVVRNAHIAQIIEISLKCSPLWSLFSKFALTVNMRAAPDEKLFAKWLLQIGDGCEPVKQDKPFDGAIKLPKACIIDAKEDMTDSVYDHMHHSNFISRAILTPTNDESLRINDLVISRLPGELKTYFSADSIITDDPIEQSAYPVEFLNRCTPSGLPPHLLNLKVGAVVILLRNLDLDHGLCNGTRLIVTHLHSNIVQCKILTGFAADNIVLIPRIQLTPSDTGLPFQLCRRQFPLRLAYSMTISKAQGQSFDKVGIFLRRPCFSHGQLYVALSRAHRLNDIKIQLIPNSLQGECDGESYTTNVVYRQVLE